MDVVGHDGLIRDIRAGRIPSFDRLVSLFEYLAIPFSYGAGPAPQGVAEPSGGGFGAPEALRAGFLPFPWHRAAKTRGMGPVAFSAAWLAQAGLAPEALSFVAPDVVLSGAAGALVLVDQTAQRSGGPALWCFVEEGSIVMAQLHWQARGVLTVTGDRPEHPARVLIGPERDLLQIIGRVVWRGTRV